jgi:prepilin-type N-terminal cleavage/methylation domain-containing protein
VKGNFKLWWAGKKDEQGMTLVEILIAVSIMSIISVTIMGYFVSAIEKSADQSRRVIAANLARLKMAEIRQVFRDDTQFENLNNVLDHKTHNTEVYANDADITSDFITYKHDYDINPYFRFIDSHNEINGTFYRYLVGFDRVTGTDVSTAIESTSGLVQNYLITLNVTVYWTASETTTPSGKFSTTLQSYVVKRR